MEEEEDLGAGGPPPASDAAERELPLHSPVLVSCPLFAFAFPLCFFLTSFPPSRPRPSSNGCGGRGHHHQGGR